MHCESKLYLCLNSDTGLYELQPLDLNKAQFRFMTQKVNNFPAYWSLVTSGKAMSASTDNNWDIVAKASSNDKNSWMQPEQISDNHIKLRGVWQTSNYCNFDSKTPGSNIYSDKSTGALFQMLTYTETGLNPITIDQSVTEPKQSYSLSGQVVDDSYKGVVVKSGKKVLRK